MRGSCSSQGGCQHKQQVGQWPPAALNCHRMLPMLRGSPGTPSGLRIVSEIWLTCLFQLKYRVQTGVSDSQLCWWTHDTGRWVSEISNFIELLWCRPVCQAPVHSAAHCEPVQSSLTHWLRLHWPCPASSACEHALTSGVCTSTAQCGNTAAGTFRLATGRYTGVLLLPCSRHAKGF